MQQDKLAYRYGTTAQLLHWLTVLLVATAWALGTFDDVLPKGAGRAAGLFVHISVGIAILVISIVRVPWRLTHTPTPEPTRFGAWMGRWTDPAARIAHYALYLLLVAVPITGIVLQFARGNPLPLFGIGEIPSPWVADVAFARNVKGVHEVMANALVILASFHALAALLHHFVFRDRTLVRMLPPVTSHDNR
jgi:cytochrome b561